MTRPPLEKRHNYSLQTGLATCLKCGKKIEGLGAALAALHDYEECPQS